MGKGYLFILIGAVLSANLLVPLPPDLAVIWNRLNLWGYLLIALGIRELRGSIKELQSARFFTLGALIAGISFNLVVAGRLNILFMHLLIVGQLFFSMGIFFWILKGEYMWLPNRFRRLDLIIYSGVAVVYLLTFAIFLAPNFFPHHFWQYTVQFLSRTPLTLDLSFTAGGNALMITSILYYVVLWFTLAKLYMETRRGD